MGPAVDPLQDLTAEYMFGLLGYSTWSIYRGRKLIGVVTLNAMDRSTTWSPGEDVDYDDSFFGLRSWTWWMHWLRRNWYTPL